MSVTSLHPKQREWKAKQLEKYAEEQLKGELQRVTERRDKVYEQTSDYIKLRDQIQQMQRRLKEDTEAHGSDARTDMRVQVNLGNEFYMQAHVPDMTRIYVDVGLGFHAELTLDEAVEWIGKKEAALNEVAARLTDTCAHIRFQLKLTYELMGQLMGVQGAAPE